MSATWRSVQVIVVGIAWAAAAHAEDPQPSGVAACRDIADATARLACFDRTTATPPASPARSTPAPRTAAKAASVTAAPVTPLAATAAPAAATSAPEERFGLPEHKVVEKEIAAGTRDKDASKIQAQIVQLQAAPDRRLVFTLDNSQVWRQLMVEGEDLLVKPGDIVTISRGLLGSYWLQTPSSRGCKVTRLR